jgi:hypothetical protein
MRSALLALCRDAENSATNDALRRGRSRKGVGRWAFAALVGCVALLALAPVAVAAGTGSIEGTVTESAHKALANVSVTVYGTDEEIEGTASTNASGEYTVSGLSEGEYKVGFSDQPTYANQYYNKQSSFGAASFVSVTEGSATSGIDAEMLQPGKITGRVTNTSGTPIADVSVDIYDSGFDFEPTKFAFTDANGEYTVEGLQEGEYRVGFFPSNPTYILQYYNGQTSLTSSTPVLVTAGGVAAGINATLIEGGKISGVITDAYTHVGLSKIEVYAHTSNGEFASGFATTNAKGEYTITGSYRQSGNGHGGSDHVGSQRCDGALGTIQYGGAECIWGRHGREPAVVRERIVDGRKRTRTIGWMAAHVTVLLPVAARRGADRRSYVARIYRAGGGCGSRSGV